MTHSIKLIDAKLFSYWNWDLKNDVCSICRNDLTDDSIYYTERNIKSIVVKGICGHALHKDCVESWLLMYESCPLCNDKKWEYTKN
jgi:hypothetical protein